jgi:type I site-specific restriction-modification system R (restriction) subunit
LACKTKAAVLHELKDSLDDLGVYESSEVDEFFEKYFKGVDASKLSPIIDKAAQRFNIELELEDEEKDLLDSIINAFNEKWFHGWEATPEEQRVKFINLMDKVKTHDDFKSKYQENQDSHTRRLALEKIVAEVMNKERRKELDLYKLFAGDDAFRVGMLDSFERVFSSASI